MNFEVVFRLLLEEFQRYKINFAIIGGFALHVAGVTRATEDIDLLVAKEDAPKIKSIMLSYGYELFHESEDVANFLDKLAELGKVDFLLDMGLIREYFILFNRENDLTQFLEKFKNA